MAHQGPSAFTVHVHARVEEMMCLNVSASGFYVWHGPLFVKTIQFCQKANLNYVSCSGQRVPITRLAAAHAKLR